MTNEPLAYGTLSPLEQYSVAELLELMAVDYQTLPLTIMVDDANRRTIQDRCYAVWRFNSKAHGIDLLDYFLILGYTDLETWFNAKEKYYADGKAPQLLNNQIHFED